MALVRHIETTDSGLSNVPVKDGQLIITTDTNYLYRDIGEVRCPIGDIVMVENEEEREGLITPLNKLYFVKESVAFWYFDGQWKQVSGKDNDDISPYTVTVENDELMYTCPSQPISAYPTIQGDTAATLTVEDISNAFKSVEDSDDTFARLSVKRSESGDIYLGGFDFSEIKSDIVKITVLMKYAMSSSMIVPKVDFHVLDSDSNYRKVSSTTAFPAGPSSGVTNTKEFTILSGDINHIDVQNLYLRVVVPDFTSSVNMRIYGITVTVETEGRATPLKITPRGGATPSVTLIDDPVNDNDAVPKKYVDSIKAELGDIAELLDLINGETYGDAYDEIGVILDEINGEDDDTYGNTRDNT